DASRASTLGPLTGAAADIPDPLRPSVNVEHRENDNCASLRPAPIGRVNVRDGFLLVSELVNTVVAGPAEGGGDVGAATTTAVGADVADVDPPLFVAVTVICRVVPTSAVTRA